MWKKIEKGFQWITNRLFGKAKELGSVRGVVYFYNLCEKADSLDFSLAATVWMPRTGHNEMLVRKVVESYVENKSFWTGDRLVPVEFKWGELEYRHES